MNRSSQQSLARPRRYLRLPVSRGLADRSSARRIQIALGLLWLLDGVLQLQPFMFGKGFANEIIAPAADGQPAFVSAGVHWSAALILTHPAIFDAGFAAVQLALGIGLLLRPTVRIALGASIAWALSVWYLGEGLGGLASGHARMLTGAPGAALLYAILAAALWPRLVGRRHDANRHATVARWIPFAWAMVWVGGAVLNMLPGQNAVASTSAIVTANADGAPRWLANLDHYLGTAVRHGGTGLLIAVVVVQVLIGVGALRNGTLRRAAALTGAALSVVYWAAGQSFGELYSGQATDPDSGVLMLLFAAALLSTVRPNAVEEVNTAEPEAATRAPLRTAA